MTMKAKPIAPISIRRPSAATLAALVLLSTGATGAQAFRFLDGLVADEILAAASGGKDEGSTLAYPHVVDAFLVTVVAWSVLTVTLEVNDFHYHLAKAHDESTPSVDSDRQYAATLAALHYGTLDALRDWAIIYTVGYAVVGGITWHNAEPNSLLVFWGFSLMCSALLLAVSGLKIPEWLGFYKVSSMQTIRDTSGLAPDAVAGLYGQGEGSSVTAFRYQVRLGVGKHFSTFFWVLLPFYYNLKFWYYLLSILFGFLCGQLYLFGVHMCHCRFKKNRGRVAICASLFAFLGSSAAFTRGKQVVEEGWKRMVGQEYTLLLVSFFTWLAMCLLFQAFKFFEQRWFPADEEEAVLFETARGDEDDTGSGNKTGLETLTEGDDSELGSPSLEESLLSKAPSSNTSRRDLMKKYSGSEEGYVYTSARFQRIKLKKSSSVSSDDGEEEEIVDTREVYRTIVDAEESNGNAKWYNRAWRALPIQPVWNLFLRGTNDACRCCKRDPEFKAMPCGKRAWFVMRKFLKVAINVAGILFAFLLCGAAIETQVTKEKLPYVKSIYSHMNTGKVCAYDKKCGNITTFANLEKAQEDGFKVAHCGKCSGCSNWNDLRVQWTTRDKAAKLAQQCGVSNLFDRDSMATCMSSSFGWTRDCAYAWVHSVECARENCAFIAILGKLTNRMGNFKVGPDSITAATCNEAQCEQGNPGNFAKLSGASRRKMNIRSSIARPPDQQCQIVDNAIPKDSDGYNDWGDFFGEACPRDISPP